MEEKIKLTLSHDQFISFEGTKEQTSKTIRKGRVKKMKNNILKFVE